MSTLTAHEVVANLRRVHAFLRTSNGQICVREWAFEGATDIALVERYAAQRAEQFQEQRDFELGRLAAVSSAALGYYDEAKPEDHFWSAAIDDVLRLRQRAEAAERELAVCQKSRDDFWARIVDWNLRHESAERELREEQRRRRSDIELRMAANDRLTEAERKLAELTAAATRALETPLEHGGWSTLAPAFGDAMCALAAVLGRQAPAQPAAPTHDAATELERAADAVAERWASADRDGMPATAERLRAVERDLRARAAALRGER